MHLMSSPLAFRDLLEALRSVAEPTRLRLLSLCAEGEWTVSELTQIVAQSQPRVSRHLKLLADGGLVERVREGAWVFYRRVRGSDAARLARMIEELLDPEDPMIMLDRQRLAAVRERRRRQAQAYFDGRAAAWDSERDIAVDGAVVEAAIRDLLGGPLASLLDIGTGTGRVLQVVAPQIEFGLGIDSSRDMLAVARANLDRRELRNCQVRHGDMYSLPLPDASFAATTLHQVLHFADDPLAVLAEARRILEPGGLLVIVDLASHGEEWLRTEKAHRRLGFGDAEIADWFAELGLEALPARRFVGRCLTVVVWSARRREAGGLEPGAIKRRAAA